MEWPMAVSRECPRDEAIEIGYSGYEFGIDARTVFRGNEFCV
tara:strand:- start:3737 stop:3862 length:126 start_codon:yes stop_codon:yes gene_type:complete